MKARAKVNRQTVESAVKTAKVQFPIRSQILSDAGIVSAMDAEWQQTLIDSTPTQYRERGFFVYLDTTTDTYAADDYDHSQWAIPGKNIYWFWDELNEPTPRANATGAKYPVARFHTHTPEEYAPANYQRDSGPNLQDEPTAKTEKTPGFVYDYDIPTVHGGYAETNSAIIHPYGPIRKATPSHEE